MTSFAWSEFVLWWIMWSVAVGTFKGFWNERGCCSSFNFVKLLELFDGTFFALLCLYKNCACASSSPWQIEQQQQIEYISSSKLEQQQKHKSQICITWWGLHKLFWTELEAINSMKKRETCVFLTYALYFLIYIYILYT